MSFEDIFTVLHNLFVTVSVTIFVTEFWMKKSLRRIVLDKNSTMNHLNWNFCAVTDQRLELFPVGSSLAVLIISRRERIFQARIDRNKSSYCTVNTQGP